MAAVIQPSSSLGLRVCVSTGLSAGSTATATIGFPRVANTCAVCHIASYR